MHRTGVAGERDTPRDLGCQWIKKASQKPLDDLDTRGAHKAFRLQLEIWAEDAFVSRAGWQSAGDEAAESMLI